MEGVWGGGACERACETEVHMDLNFEPLTNREHWHFSCVRKLQGNGGKEESSRSFRANRVGDTRLLGLPRSPGRHPARQPSCGLSPRRVASPCSTHTPSTRESQCLRSHWTRPHLGPPPSSVASRHPRPHARCPFLPPTPADTSLSNTSWNSSLTASSGSVVCRSLCAGCLVTAETLRSQRGQRPLFL